MYAEVVSDTRVAIAGMVGMVLIIAWLARRPADWKPWGFWGWPADSNFRGACIGLAVAVLIVNAFAIWFSFQT
jgi:hypothetical protein